MGGSGTANSGFVERATMVPEMAHIIRFVQVPLLSSPHWQLILSLTKCLWPSTRERRVFVGV